MIKALIIVHLWSLIVAGSAWILQRDGNERIGARFPAPGIWLTLIILSFLPGVLFLIPFDAAISLPKIGAFEVFATQASVSSVKDASFPYFLTFYIGLGILLVSRTLWGWSRLQTLRLVSTTESDIFTTTTQLPPLTLSWPRRAVVIPPGFETQSALIRHERAHLHHRDAELTLLLLLLQDLMLRSPGLSYLVRQWRLSIELRADHAATKMLTASERKDYAALLLNIQRPTREGGTTLPCPTARLDSTRHRNVKIRLMGIIENERRVGKQRWLAAIFLTSIGASAIGLVSAVASVKEMVIDAANSPVEYVFHTPLQLPATCPGLSLDGVRTEVKELTVDGELVPQHTLKLGTVILNHDIRRDGSIHNPRIIDSTHSCFEADAKSAIVQWMTVPQEFEIKDAAVKLHFVISGATIDDLKQQLDGFY